MVDYYFRPQPAVDREGDRIAEEGSGQIFAITDTTFSTPLTFTADGGATGTTMSVSAIGQTIGFTVVDHAEVYFKSGDLVSPLVAWSSIVADAAASRAATQSSALAAQQAQQAAETLANQLAATVLTVNGQTPDESGNVNVAGGGGGGDVVTVNGKGPNGNGNVTLVPSDISAAPVSHTHSADQIISGIIATARLGSGTASSSTWLRGDNTWAALPGGGGGVATVNSQAPDGSGNVVLSKTHINLGAVDNTADANKPVSTLQQSALNQKANDSAVVKLTGAQTVAGAKTFSSSPIVPDSSFSQAKISGLIAALAGKVGSTSVGEIQVISQAAYDSLPSTEASTLYLTTGA